MDDSDVEDGIMEATRRSLCEHGYAGLTMQDIADESEKSKATLHYHYGTKDELLFGFLEYILDEFHEKIESVESENAKEEVVEILTPRSDDVSDSFRTAVLEMKAQSPYNQEIRSRLVEHEDALRRRLESVVRRGVEEGVFRDDTDPAETAEFLVTLGNGVHTRSVTVGKTDDELRDSVEEYVERYLAAPEEGV